MPPARSPANAIRPLARATSRRPRQQDAGSQPAKPAAPRPIKNIKNARNVIQPFRGAKWEAQQRQFNADAKHFFAFEAARNIAESRGTGAKARTARDLLKAMGPDAAAAGREMIRGRAQRAAAAAARGFEAGRRALAIYDRQLSPATPRGRGPAARNNLRPGPRNTQGPPPKAPKAPKPRKPRKPKK